MGYQGGGIDQGTDVTADVGAAAAVVEDGKQTSGATVYDGLENGAMVDDGLSRTPSTGVGGCEGSYELELGTTVGGNWCMMEGLCERSRG